MTSIFDNVHLSPRSVRGLGMALVVVGLLLPLAAVVYHAATWVPSTEVKRIGPLRPEMVILPAGTFQMGSPPDEPGRDDDEVLHEVKLTKPFMISRTEITQGQYLAVMGGAPSEQPSQRTDTLGNSCADAGLGEDLPVVCVDWFEAVHFCNKLSTMEGLDQAYVIEGSKVTWDAKASGYRLPTEAEWEYAARAGTRHRFAGTDDESMVCEFGNVASCNAGFKGLAPVASKQPNRWQLFDMTGNAWEWVWDGYAEYPGAGVEDPKGYDGASDRVYRGGSWWFTPRVARVAIRYRVDPSSRGGGLGFRVARSLPSTL